MAKVAVELRLLKMEIDDLNWRKIVVPVVVLNWNGFDDTKQAVTSLLSQKLLAKVVLIDNNSKAKEVLRLKHWVSELPKVELRLNSSNLGFGKAHNLVFKELVAEGYPYVACLNNDAIAEPDWLENMLFEAERTQASMIASLMIMSSDHNRVDNTGHGILSTAEIIPIGHGDSIKNHLSSKRLIGPCAGACLYGTEMLEKLEYFDERFFVGYEDAEFGLRAWLCGYDCYYSPKARVLHKMSASIGRIRKTEYLAEIQSHIFYTWFKLMPRSTILRQIPSMLFKYGMVLLIDLVFLRFKFFGVMTQGIRNSMKDRTEIRLARKNFQVKNKLNRSNREINDVLIPFFVFDLKRFWKHVVLGKKTALEE